MLPLMSRIHCRKGSWLVLALLLGVGIPFWPAQAYPPAPFHLLYGMLRDEYGTPISISSAEVILETSSGVKIKTSVNPGIEMAANYRLEVPMDAGLLAAPYQPTALRPMVPFRIKVRIGGITYLPIEMLGDYSKLGKPGHRTRLNLTLGEDSDGDGLPDAWERLVHQDIAQVQPGSDAGNGLNYLQTYYAGTYAVDPEHGFVLSIVGHHQGSPLLEFLAVTGRTYTVQGSLDLKTWTTLPFRIPSEGMNAPVRASYRTDSVRTVRIEVPGSEPAASVSIYRLVLE